jgi:hypothetical protein
MVVESSIAEQVGEKELRYWWSEMVWESRSGVVVIGGK